MLTFFVVLIAFILLCAFFPQFLKGCLVIIVIILFGMLAVIAYNAWLGYAAAAAGY